jgi:hypothetical protein
MAGSLRNLLTAMIIDSDGPRTTGFIVEADGPLFAYNPETMILKLADEFAEGHPNTNPPPEIVSAVAKASGEYVRLMRDRGTYQSVPRRTAAEEGRSRPSLLASTSR